MDDRSSARTSTSVSFVGGLGNRLFQLAAGLTAQQMRGGELVFYDLRTLTRWPAEQFLQRGSAEDLPDHFSGIPYRYRFGFADRWTWKIRRQPRRMAKAVWGRIRDVQSIRQTSGYAPIPPGFQDLSGRNVDLRGYFQHPSWFEPALEQVTDLIRARLSPVVDELLPMHGTAISLRLGDYRNSGAELPPEYYRRAVRALGRVDGPVWIVSQEPDAQELLAPILGEFGLRADPLPDLPVDPVVRDLALLGAAANVVMSNSTFCWWGVVAGRASREPAAGKVVAPDQWLPRSPGSTSLARSGWNLIPAAFTRDDASAGSDVWRTRD